MKMLARRVDQQIFNRPIFRSRTAVWSIESSRHLFLRTGLATVLIGLLLSASAFSTLRQASGHTKQTLILISLDGFRWDYLNRGVSPNINALASEGVRAKTLIPVFPSLTFPNHYSIVTGVYPEKHGIVGNSMYDPEFKASFSRRHNAGESRWWGAEPIWTTVQKQGKVSAVFFWPGSEAEVDGIRPAYWKKYDDKVPNSERVEQVFTWLELPAEKRPSFIALYFSDVDRAGHEFGPDSQEVSVAIRTVDKSIGVLVDGLRARGLSDTTDTIIVSDHGMTAANGKQRVIIKDYIDSSLIERVIGGEDALIWPAAGKELELYQSLKKVPHITVYRKSDTPEHFHFRNNRRIAPIVCVADEGWQIEPAHRAGESVSGRTTGAHGYDPRLPSMQGIFVAAGPDIRRKLVIESFVNVQIYNLMCRILTLKPAANDGDAGWADAVLTARGASASQGFH